MLKLDIPFKNIFTILWEEDNNINITIKKKTLQCQIEANKGVNRQEEFGWCVDHYFL